MSPGSIFVWRSLVIWTQVTDDLSGGRNKIPSNTSGTSIALFAAAGVVPRIRESNYIRENPPAQFSRLSRIPVEVLSGAASRVSKFLVSCRQNSEEKSPLSKSFVLECRYAAPIQNPAMGAAVVSKDELRYDLIKSLTTLFRLKLCLLGLGFIRVLISSRSVTRPGLFAKAADGETMKIPASTLPQAHSLLLGHHPDHRGMPRRNRFH